MQQVDLDLTNEKVDNMDAAHQETFNPLDVYKDYIDLEKVRLLLEGVQISMGLVSAIVSLEGELIARSNISSFCSRFHIRDKACSSRCRESIAELTEMVRVSKSYQYHTCANGLVEVAIPIMINGFHVSNLISGQFFFEEPDIDYFRNQAKEFGFDEELYIESIKEVPIVSRERAKKTIEYLLLNTQMFGELTYQKLKLAELNQSLLERGYTP